MNGRQKNVTTPSPMTPYSLNSAHVTLLSGEGGGVTSQAPLFRNPLIIPFYRPAQRSSSTVSMPPLQLDSYYFFSFCWGQGQILNTSPFHTLKYVSFYLCCFLPRPSLEACFETSLSTRLPPSSNEILVKASGCAIGLIVPSQDT